MFGNVLHCSTIEHCQTGDLLHSDSCCFVYLKKFHLFSPVMKNMSAVDVHELRMNMLVVETMVDCHMGKLFHNVFVSEDTRAVGSEIEFLKITL